MYTHFKLLTLYVQCKSVGKNTSVKIPLTIYNIIYYYVVYTYIIPNPIDLKGKCAHLFFLNQQLLLSKTSSKYWIKTKNSNNLVLIFFSDSTYILILSIFYFNTVKTHILKMYYHININEFVFIQIKLKF